MADDPSTGSRESQRRQATVFFADISGFTAMSERLDPEDVTDIMNGCFAMVERIVHEHGGQVDKYIGDAVMALFGASQALENAARRAVLASMEIRSGLEQFNRERDLPVPLQVHIGVNSGLVIAGEVGGQVKREFTVMGDTVNLAARLEDASEKGQIFVGPSTWAATREDFEYKPTKPLSLKGKSEPVQAYEVVGLKEKTHLPKLGTTTRHIASKIVGREKEVAALTDRLASLLAGEGGIVSIVGDAGIGKSRLLAEISQSPQLEQASVLLGRSEAVGSGVSYQPFVELLRDWAGIKRTSTDEQALGELDTAFDSLPGISKEEVLPFVATLMGCRLSGARANAISAIDPDAMEKLVVKAMHDLLEALAEPRPLLLCFEDLHWADLSSVKLLEALLHLCAKKPILFVLATRPRFEETSGRILAVARERFAPRHFELALEPLDARQSHALIRNLLHIDNLPHRTREIITRRAEGNPFFIEEVVRSLIEGGAVEVVDGRLAVTDKIESITIPATLQEVILTRVERLDPAARHLLEMGAVLGRSFLHEILAAVSGKGESELRPVLDRLKERQVLLERAVRRTTAVRRATLVADVEYVFNHALIQETIYESLLNRIRRELHLRAAEAIEQRYVDRLEDFFAMLALHYSRAEKLEKAEEYLRKAGDEAVRSAASAEALYYFREAYRIFQLRHGEGGDPKTRLGLEKSLARALMLTGNLSEARPHFDRALTALGEKVARTKKGAYRQLAANALRILFRVYVLRGRMSSRASTPELRDAIDLMYSRVMAECVADQEWFPFDAMYMVGRLTTVDPRTIDEAFAEWAGVALLFSYSGFSFDLSRRILAIIHSLVRDDRPADFFTYNLMGFMCDYFEGVWDRPPGVSDELTEQVLRTGHFWHVDTFLGMDAYKQVDRGDWEAAHHRLRKITEIAKTYGYSFAETNQMAIPIFEAVAKRDLQRALVDLEAYLDRPEEALNLIGLGNQAKVLTLLGRREEAGQALEKADRLVARMGQTTPFHSGWFRAAKLLFDVAELEAAAGRDDRRRAAAIRKRAAQNARLALRTASVLALIRTEVYRLVGTLHWLSGHKRKSVRWWEKSLATGEQLGARPELARTHAEIARRLAGKDTPVVGGKTSAEHAQAARDAFAALGLARDLAELEALFPGGSGEAGQVEHAVA
jgi:class 3 adenylate cyclase/tetratricopeptide (TPR) repeat protein